MSLRDRCVCFLSLLSYQLASLELCEVAVGVSVPLHLMPEAPLKGAPGFPGHPRTRALTMTLPFWFGCSKILLIDHDDNGAARGARGEAWDGATARVRRDDSAGGSDELLLGAGVRADLGT